MNRYDTCERTLEQLQLRRPDERLLQQVSMAVEQMMGQEAPNVESVARRMEMPVSTLRRRIKSATTLTAADFITTLRMRRALELMEWWPEVTMAQVARQCGFADGTHLAHVFKRLFGTSPSHYLKALEKNR